MAGILVTSNSGWVVSGRAYRDVMNRVIMEYGEDDADAETVRIAISVGGISLNLLEDEQAHRLARKILHAAQKLREEIEPTARSGASMMRLLDDLAVRLRPMLSREES